MITRTMIQPAQRGGCTYCCRSTTAKRKKVRSSIMVSYTTSIIHTGKPVHSTCAAQKHKQHEYLRARIPDEGIYHERCRMSPTCTAGSAANSCAKLKNIKEAHQQRSSLVVAADAPSPLAVLGREGREQATPRLDEPACCAHPALRKPPACGNDKWFPCNIGPMKLLPSRSRATKLRAT